MATCPNGHASSSTDYCDECGTPIGAPPSAPRSATSTAPAPAQSGGTCPDCGTPRDGRFCEVCGRDFLAEPSTPAPYVPQSAPDPFSGNGSGGVAAGADDPHAAGAGGPEAAVPVTAGSGSGESSDGTANSPAPAGEAGIPVTAGSILPSRGAVSDWRVVVTADRAYHARMASASMPDAQPIAFPAFCPERRFALGGGQVLIGRRSRSRGIEPQIDLTGPPEDAGVSHAHALLVVGQDGNWSVVDLDSANGTYVNESGDPIAANVPVPLADGDRVHVGAWTTLTVQVTP
jgi:hypothetical protein